MFEQLQGISGKLEEIERMLADPEVVSDLSRYRKLMKEQAELSPLRDRYRLYCDALGTIRDSEELLQTESDPEMISMLKEELQGAKQQEAALKQELQVLLLPRDPNDEKNVVVEIRAGVGGDEAALFASQIYRMYVRYADRRGWRTELTSVNENGIGGFKECVFLMGGDGVWSRMKYEGGIHRVQRVPETESGGRIHTSAVTVAVMPEADEIDQSVDLSECRFDVFRASGNGGQCVNTTDSAVRLVHIPTGIVISCQDEKSQLKNKDKAIRILRSKLYQLRLMDRQDEESQLRRSQVRSGDRSEKIRTYNFPQGRVTDHRIRLTLYRIDQIMDGDLDILIDPLIAADESERLMKAEGKEEKTVKAE